MSSIPSVPGLPELRWLNNVVGDAHIVVSDSDAVLTMVTGEKTDWFNPPPDHSSSSTTASPSQLSNAPALVFTPPHDSDEWQLSAQVTGPNDWCKLCFEYSPEQVPTVVSVVTREISDDANGAAIPDSNTVHLRVSKYGNGVLAFHYSTNGGEYWTLHRVFCLGRGGGDGDRHQSKNAMAIGFLAQAPTGKSCTARFSDISFTKTTLKNLRDGS